jgi:CheY-like chemotaxis protein
VVCLRATRHDDGIAFLVEDEGPGVPPGERARIFEPFYSTKGPSKGTGLGLAIVQRVARDHGGEVSCHDRPGGGARFLLYLPPAPEGTQPGAPPRLPPAPRAAFARVLVVDDEALLREAMAEALRHAGHTVHEAAHAEAAFVLAARETFDVLVTDVLMPGISGVELAKRLSVRQPALRVILVTGFLREEDRWPGWSDEWRVVEKPFRADEIVRVVATLLRDPAAPVAEDSAAPAG